MEPALTLMPATATPQLGDVELLALTLGHVSMRRAARLLARFHNLGGLARAPLADFELERMTPRRALQLQAALELGRRSLARPFKRGVELTSPTAVAEYLAPRLVTLEQEEIHVIGVDVRQRLIIHSVVAQGSVDQVHVSPRDVYRLLVRENCRGAIVVHNHPSGDPEPSDSDRALTRQLQEAGAIVGVTLIDHIILARRGQYSFKMVGALENQEFGQ